VAWRRQAWGAATTTAGSWGGCAYRCAQTDALPFSAHGFPVVLINEHMDEVQNFGRIGYHDTEDTSALINWDYGTSVARVAIMAVAVLAGMHAAPPPPADGGTGVTIAVSVVCAIGAALGLLWYCRWRRNKIARGANKYVPGEYSSLVTA
jgi:hypothetical protein